MFVCCNDSGMEKANCVCSDWNIKRQIRCLCLYIAVIQEHQQWTICLCIAVTESVTLVSLEHEKWMLFVVV